MILRFLACFLVVFPALSTIMAAEKPVHFFILSGQSNMAGMNPEKGFIQEANKLLDQKKNVLIAPKISSM